MSKTFSQEFVITYKNLFTSTPFFPPLTATRPEGCVHAGAIEKQRLGLFCSSS